MSETRIPDPTLMARLQLSVKGVDWAASLVAPYQHQQVDGEWSAHQNVYHLLGNEHIFQERIQRVLKEERPELARWDSAAFMAAHTIDIDIQVLAERFMEQRGKTVDLLKPLSEGQWFRTGVWPDGREVDLAWIAEKALWHALDHFAGLLDIHGSCEAIQAPRWKTG